MLFKNLLLAIILGLLTSLTAYYKTTSFDYIDLDPRVNLCNAEPEYDIPATLRQKGGVPFESVKTKQVLVMNCSAQYLDKNTEISTSLGTLMKTWQFYANWAVWTLPALGIVYLVDKKYANPRH